MDSKFKVGELVIVEGKEGAYVVEGKDNVHGSLLPVYHLEKVSALGDYVEGDNILAQESAIKALQYVSGIGAVIPQEPMEKLSDTISIDTEPHEITAKVGSLHFDDRDDMCRALNADNMYGLVFEIDQELRLISRNPPMLDRILERLDEIRQNISRTTNEFAYYD